MKSYTKIAAVLLFILGPLLFIYICFRRSSWDESSRFRYALVDPKGDVYISVLVPSKNEVSIAKLKPDSEVEAAHGLGKWKISSLLALGKQEKIGGNELIRETLVQGFGVPIEGIWLENIKGLGRWSLIQGMLSGTGDLSFATRIRIITFILRSPIDLWTDELLPKNILTLTREPLNDVSEGIIEIVNKTDDKNVYLNEISSLIENLGGKVINITDESASNGTCDVYGDSLFAKKLSLVLQCKYTQADGVQRLVVENDFLKRF